MMTICLVLDISPADVTGNNQQPFPLTEINKESVL